MSRSLRQRLILILLLLMLFAWISATLLTVMASSRVLIDQVDRQLNQYSELVYYMTQIFAQGTEEHLMEAHPGLGELIRANALPILIDSSSEEELAPALNVWQGDTLIAALEGSPRFEHPEREGFAFRKDPQGDGGWRILVRHHSENDLWLLVGIDLERARWQILQILGRAFFPLLVVLPLTVAVLYFGVSRGLQPIKQLADQIAERSPRQLDAFSLTDVPKEIVPVVESLNNLLRRLGEAMESEQRFTANAAHELKTPLAAIKTEVQLCQRQVTDPTTGDMLSRIALRVDRATHTVEQLLTLARLDPEADLPMERVDLRALIQAAVIDTVHVSERAGLDIQVPEGEPVWIEGEPESLSMLLRNALVNAFLYASGSSLVRVELDEYHRGTEMRICNDCEPITSRDFEQLRERFYRLPGSNSTGAGLGLSIVQRVAGRHKASLALGPDPQRDPRGFSLSLRFEASS